MLRYLNQQLMCGRYGLTIDQEALSAAYAVELFLTDHRPRYNIAPSQNAPVLLGGPDGRRVEAFRWGLLPPWAKDERFGYRTINARSEGIASKPAFRGAWRGSRRCLVLADGFYEWQKPASGKGPKTPHWIHMADRRPFGFAGLWESWRGDGEEVRSCTIITTEANDLVRPVHDRMPVILGDPGQWEAWIDPGVGANELEELLAPYPAEEMHVYPVSTYVNKPGNEGPECVLPILA